MKKRFNPPSNWPGTIHIPKREFNVGDWVIYMLSWGCSRNNISKPGRIDEVLGDGMYVVTFGFESFHGTRTGKATSSNLWSIDLFEKVNGNWIPKQS